MNNSTGISNQDPSSEDTCNECHFDLSKAELPIVLLLTLVLNGAAIYILIKIRPTCVSVDNTCVLVLAVNDFVTAALYSVMWIGGWIKCGCLMGRHLCNVLGWFATSMVIWSAWVVIILAGCRYLATIKPLYYRAHVTGSSIHVSMVATLCLTLLQLTFPFFGVAAQYKFYPGNRICAYDFSPGASGGIHRGLLGFLSAEGLMASIVVLYLNACVICKMRQKNVIHIENTIVNSDIRRNKRTALANVTKVVSAVYIICYTPFLVRVLYDVIINSPAQDEARHHITMVLLFLSPLINPLIYVGCNRRYRDFILDTFGGCWSKIKPKAVNNYSVELELAVTTVQSGNTETTDEFSKRVPTEPTEL